MSRFASLVAVSNAVAATPGRLAKVAHLAQGLRGLDPDELPVGVAYLAGQLPQGRLGIGPALLRSAREVAPAREASLEILTVDRALSDFGAIEGAGSGARRREVLGALFAAATAPEQDYLARLLLGELRQGALEGIMVEALAHVAAVPSAAVRRGLMLSGDLAAVAAVALHEGAVGLGAFDVRLFEPLSPMLAQVAEDMDGTLAELGEAALDYKLDGARVQVHKAGETVRVFTRRLNEVTAAVPEVVESALALPARELILDGEAIALRGDGRPQPFQLTMRRFGRKADDPALRAQLPLSPFYFDCLYLDGESLIDAPAGQRLARLAAVLPPALAVPRLVTGDAGAAREFLRQALAAGHEGVMAKSLAAPYEAGNRGSAWRKIKSAHTLDLVVLAAEWGNGRRAGWLSNLHLGARDPVTGGFVMLGKTFKGLTDRMLAWQTEYLQSIATAREGHVVHVRPELVVEIAFNDIQASPRYPAGLALRFARVKAYRPDKPPAQADTIDTVRTLHRLQAG